MLAVTVAPLPRHRNFLLEPARLRRSKKKSACPCQLRQSVPVFPYMRTKLRLSCSFGVVAMCLLACAKVPTATDPSAKAVQHNPSTSASRGRGVLTREEVAAILGAPVTSMEGAASDMQYRTDTLSLEATVGIETQSDPDQAMAGARKATSMLGGTPEEVPSLGDEAFFGAMSVLYVRKGENIITITPPNFQRIAAMAAYSKVTAAPLGSDEQKKAMEDFQGIEKNDPLKVGLSSADATQGALATVATASRKQGTPDEERGRAVAMALATKVVSKL